MQTTYARFPTRTGLHGRGRLANPLACADTWVGVAGQDVAPPLANKNRLGGGIVGCGVG